MQKMFQILKKKNSEKKSEIQILHFTTNLII